MFRLSQPCEDVDFLLNKFQSDVANVTGVPMDMVHGVTRVNESSQKTMSSGRLFMAKMTDLCRKLQMLLAEVYRDIYGDADVRFFMVPMSRLEINSVADLKVLFDAGCLTPDMSLQLSSLLLGEELHNKRRRMQMVAGADRKDNEEMDGAGLKRFKQSEKNGEKKTEKKAEKKDEKNGEKNGEKGAEKGKNDQGPPVGSKTKTKPKE